MNDGSLLFVVGWVLWLCIQMDSQTWDSSADSGYLGGPTQLVTAVCFSIWLAPEALSVSIVDQLSGVHATTVNFKSTLVFIQSYSSFTPQTLTCTNTCIGSCSAHYSISISRRNKTWELRFISCSSDLQPPPSALQPPPICVCVYYGWVWVFLSLGHCGT